MGVGTEKVALLGRYGRAVAVGDAAAGFEGRCFALQSQLGGLFAVDAPRVKQIQIAVVRFDVGFVGQTGGRVFGGEAGDVIGRLHCALDRCLRKVGRAGIAPAVVQVHGHAQRLVAVALHVFQLALAHADRQAATFRRFSARVGRAQLFGVVQGDVDQLFKMVTRVAEAVVGL